MHAKYFYPRPPRGGRLASCGICGILKLFLSTPSARRATSFRPPCSPSGSISIHALREEGDDTLRARARDLERFLSTPSARRATYDLTKTGYSEPISIHALREEGDPHYEYAGIPPIISIHALREEGDPAPGAFPCGILISIHALREEGDGEYVLHKLDEVEISIHALREEGDA